MNDLLKKIIDYKKQELEHLKRKVSFQDVRLKAEDAGGARDFLGGLKGEGTRIIAEVKKASPSAGVIRPDFDPVKIGRIYEENGASCLSVLTDGHFFQGSLRDLERIRVAVKRPLLRKDFTFDEYQIHEARGAGADAVLLIVRILEDGQIRDYLALSAELGMAALVEVHDSDDMAKAKGLNPPLIGINNRDLDTLKVDLETTVRLSKEAPKDSLLVSESGISTPADIKKLNNSGVSVFLIGETLLRSPDPGEKLRSFLG